MGKQSRIHTKGYSAADFFKVIFYEGKKQGTRDIQHETAYREISGRKNLIRINSGERNEIFRKASSLKSTSLLFEPAHVEYKLSAKFSAFFFNFIQRHNFTGVYYAHIEPCFDCIVEKNRV